VAVLRDTRMWWMGTLDFRVDLAHMLLLETVSFVTVIIDNH